MSFPGCLGLDIIINNIIIFASCTPKEASYKLLTKQATKCVECLNNYRDSFHQWQIQRISCFAEIRIQKINLLPLRGINQMAEHSIAVSLTTCHVRSFASSPLANRHLNLGMIGRYHNTFDGGPFFDFSSLLHSSSSFTLYYDTPHLGHLCISSNSCLYSM